MKNLFILTFSMVFASAISVAVVYGATANTVDLLWEGETYTPAFYAGRPLPAAGNLVRVVAIPNVIQGGQRLLSNQLVFNWIKDRNPIQSASGRGKDALEYRADQDGGSSIITVEVLNQDNRLAESRAVITTTKPKLALYRAAPLTNPSRARALAGVTPIGSTETTLLAEPFFFSPLDLTNRHVAFDWRINGERTTPRENSQLFTVAAPQGRGEVKLSVTARNEASLFQTARREITLGFGLQEFNF